MAFKDLFSFLFQGSSGEERVAQYVIREHDRGRPLAEIMEDRYVLNRLESPRSARACSTGRDHPGVGGDMAEAAKAAVTHRRLLDWHQGPSVDGERSRVQTCLAPRTAGQRVSAGRREGLVNSSSRRYSPERRRRAVRGRDDHEHDDGHHVRQRLEKLRRDRHAPRLEDERQRGEGSEGVGAHEAEIGAPEREDHERDRDPAGSRGEPVDPLGREREAEARAADAGERPAGERVERTGSA